MKSEGRSSSEKATGYGLRATADWIVDLLLLVGNLLMFSGLIFWHWRLALVVQGGLLMVAWCCIVWRKMR